jgi:uncharacterized protein (DUF1697 family)
VRQVAFLRGINLGPSNRISMPALRTKLTAAGFEQVETYLQSGNIVLASDSSPEQLERELERLIAGEFGLEVPVIVRTRDDLEGVVERNPLAAIASEPKRYQVSFLSDAPAPEVLAKLEPLARNGERIIAIGREIYAWHPAGVGRSRLAAALAGPRLGVGATARNWTTVCAVFAMAGE